MFADDMTMFHYNLESVKVVMEIFEEFYRYALFIILAMNEMQMSKIKMSHSWKKLVY